MATPRSRSLNLPTSSSTNFDARVFFQSFNQGRFGLFIPLLPAAPKILIDSFGFKAILIRPFGQSFALSEQYGANLLVDPCRNIAHALSSPVSSIVTTDYRVISLYVNKEMSEITSKIDISYRLKEARDALGMTQDKFGSDIGLKWFSIRDMESGKKAITVDIAQKIERIHCIDLRWLLTGEGAMRTRGRLQEGDHIDAFDGELPRLDCGLYGQGDFVFVPISSEKACCGKGSPIFEEYDIGESIAVKRSALGSLSESAPPYAVETQGRSMEGFGIREGSTVIVNPAERPTSGDVVLVAIDEKGAVKKYYERKEGIELVSSTSDSLRFTYEELEEGWGIRICGRVMLVIAPPEDGV